MKEELAIRAVKAFPDLFPDKWKHDFSEHRQRYCCKCKQYNCNAKQPCTVPTPIDINWDNAMKLRDEIIKKFGWGVWDYAMRMQRRAAPCPEKPEYTPDTPADYIEAACEAKEESNEAI